MIYAFINTSNDDLKQKQKVLDLAFERNIKIDVWLEGQPQLLEKIIERNYLNDGDMIIFYKFEHANIMTLAEKLGFLNLLLKRNIYLYSQDNHFNEEDFADLEIYSSYSNNIRKIKENRTKKLVTINELLDKKIPVNSICKIFNLNRKEVRELSSELVAS